MREFKAFVICVTVLILIIIAISFIFPRDSLAEEGEYPLYVTVRLLNGREHPNTDSSCEARFEKGDTVEAIQINENGWIEVYGGETGTVWCKAEYLSENPEPRYWKNTSGGSVNIRRNPSIEARREGRIKAGRVMRISAEVFGWGYIKNQGWVDLSYFERVEE